MQQREAAVASGAQLLRPALRLVLVLGGAVVVWWAIAPGSAHADDRGPSHHSLLGGVADDVSGAVRATDHARPATHAVTGPVRRTLTRLATTVEDTGRATPAPVSTVTQVVGTALDSTADTTGRITGSVDGAMTQVVDTVDRQLDHATRPPATGEPATTNPAPPARTHLRSHRSAATSVPDRMPAPPRNASVTTTVGPHSGLVAPAETTAHAAASKHAAAPADDPVPAGPAAPDPVAPGASVTAPSLVAVVGVVMVGVPLLSRLRRARGAFSLPPAPALRPACSPG